MRKKFCGSFSEVLKLWVFSFIVLAIPLDFIWRFESIRSYFSFWDIVMSLSYVAVVFFLMALMFAFVVAVLFSCSSALLGSRIGEAVLWINRGIALAFVWCIFLVFTKRWVFYITNPTLQVRGLVLVSVSFVISALMVFLFRQRLKEKLKEASNGIFKVALIISILAFGLAGFEAASSKYFRHALHAYSGTSKTLPVSLTNTAGRALPNIILITFDALSAEDMSLYGYRRKTTPHIDEFSKKAYVFENMFANSNWTSPTIASIIRGKYPSTHRMFQYYPSILKQREDQNLAHLLRLMGYETVMITGNATNANPKFNGTSDDFTHIIESGGTFYGVSAKIFNFLLGIRINAALYYGSVMGPYKNLCNKLLRILFSQVRKDSDVVEDTTFADARSYLERAQRPYFLWVHSLQPHDPYLPPEPFRYTFLKNRVVDNLEDITRYPIHRQFDFKVQNIINMLRCRYDENILYIDHKFGMFIKYIENSGIADNSVIIVSADHGESFTKGYFGHNGRYLYRPLIHIPLIIYLPLQQTGGRIYCNAEQVDIAPTILDLIGVEIPGWMEGESLRSALSGASSVDRPKFSMQLTEPGADYTFGIIRGRYKFIYYSRNQKRELFDRENDPGELNNITSLEREKADELYRAMSTRLFR